MLTALHRFVKQHEQHKAMACPSACDDDYACSADDFAQASAIYSTRLAPSRLVPKMSEMHPWSFEIDSAGPSTPVLAAPSAQASWEELVVDELPEFDKVETRCCSPIAAFKRDRSKRPKECSVPKDDKFQMLHEELSSHDKTVPAFTQHFRDSALEQESTRTCAEEQVGVLACMSRATYNKAMYSPSMGMSETEHARLKTRPRAPRLGPLPHSVSGPSLPSLSLSDKENQDTFKKSSKLSGTPLTELYLRLDLLELF
jgi:hypothetical protein